MWYRRDNGVIVGGPYNCAQDFLVEKLSDDHLDVVAFRNRPLIDGRAELMAAIDTAKDLAELKIAVKKALRL